MYLILFVMKLYYFIVGLLYISSRGLARWFLLNLLRTFIKLPQVYSNMLNYRVSQKKYIPFEIKPLLEFEPTDV
jgi:hypothetical protein